MVENEEKLEQLLRKNLRLARENNRMLRSIKRQMFWGGVTRMIVWALMLGIPVLLYVYFLKPYADNLFELYGAIGSGNPLPFLEQMGQSE